MELVSIYLLTQYKLLPLMKLQLISVKEAENRKMNSAYFFFNHHVSAVYFNLSLCILHITMIAMKINYNHDPSVIVWDIHIQKY